MLVLGIETSCDETGVALYDTQAGLIADQVHTQMVLHADYGGVVPELASRDHIRRVITLTERCLAGAGKTLSQLDTIAYTKGPGLGGALLVGASVANALAFGLGIPVIGVHHLEGHLLSPLLAKPCPTFPFVALLVSGGHTQLLAVRGIGHYQLLGDTLDDAAGEAFDKTAKRLGLAYPGGAVLSQLAEQGNPKRYTLPRPMLNADTLDMSFSGLKTAAVTLISHIEQHGLLSEADRNDICRAFQDAIVDVLVSKSLKALTQTGMTRLVVAGGVGANKALRAALDYASQQQGITTYYPPLSLCTDNGAMIALAGALRLQQAQTHYGYTVQPRWEITSLPCLILDDPA